jgi:hypothetical protein
MKLQAVFWDYPKFLDEQYLNEFIKKNKNSDLYFWIMNRFLEHARIVDTFQVFDISEISSNFYKFKLTDYSLKKWKRLIEVYSDSQRR